MRTLIVDDDSDVRSALKHILSPFGIVEEADNGIMGMDYIVKSFNNNAPHNLVVLDVVLPELSGFTLIKHIRYLEESYDTPVDKECKIVVITERYDELTVLEAINMGATGIIQKPVEREQVLAGIKRLRVT